MQMLNLRPLLWFYPPYRLWFQHMPLSKLKNVIKLEHSLLYLSKRSIGHWLPIELKNFWDNLNKLSKIRFAFQEINQEILTRLLQQMRCWIFNLRPELKGSRRLNIRHNHCISKEQSPVKNLVEVSGLEPLTPWLQTTCSANWATPPSKAQTAIYTRL